MSDFFPKNSQDEVTMSILDKHNKVLEREDKPNFIPYTDSQGNRISPFTDFIYYNKLPKVYRDYDYPLRGSFEKGPLYRYLQSIIEGGYANLVYNATQGERGIENLFELINPETCPSEFLPIYCESMGIQWFQDLIVEPSEGVDPYYFMRTFLSNIGEVYKRRGTESIVKYIAKVLTSKDVKLKYTRNMIRGVTQSRVLWVELQVNTPEEISQVGFNSEVIQRFINTQIPYYLTSKVLYVLDKGDISVRDFEGTVITKVKRLLIIPMALYAADDSDFVYEVVNNKVNIIFYKGEATRLAVPKKINNLPVAGIRATAFGNIESLEYVRLPETIEIIE